MKAQGASYAQTVQQEPSPSAQARDNRILRSCLCLACAWAQVCGQKEAGKHKCMKFRKRKAATARSMPATGGRLGGPPRTTCETRPRDSLDRRESDDVMGSSVVSPSLVQVRMLLWLVVVMFLTSTQPHAAKQRCNSPSLRGHCFEGEEMRKKEQQTPNTTTRNT